MGNGAAESLVVDLAISQNEFADTVDTQQPIFQGLADLRFLLAGVLERVEPIDTGEGDEDDGEAGEETASAAEPSGVEITPLITTTASGRSLDCDARVRWRRPACVYRLQFSGQAA